MKVNKDLPSTWPNYDSKFCNVCMAFCCSLPVEIKAQDLIRLGVATEDELNNSIKKTFKRLKKDGIVVSYREETGFFMLQQKPNGDCLFLDSVSRQCTVYTKRPSTCRDFPEKIGPRLNHCPKKRK